MRYVVMKLASGKRYGFKATYYVDDEPRLVRIENRAEISLVNEYHCSRDLRVVLEGLIRPPFQGSYVFVVEGGDHVELYLENRDIKLNKQKRALVSIPVFLKDTGYYRLKLVYTMKEPVSRLRLLWLREDGVLEVLGSNYAHSSLSNTVVFKGIKKGCEVVLRSIGVIAHAVSENEVVELDIGSVKPPIDACLEIVCNGVCERIACLRDIWGGDVYHVVEVSKLFA